MTILRRSFSGAPRACIAAGRRCVAHRGALPTALPGRWAFEAWLRRANKSIVLYIYIYININSKIIDSKNTYKCYITIIYIHIEMRINYRC